MSEDEMKETAEKRAKWKERVQKEEFKCPRRDEMGDTSMFNLPETDRWNERHGIFMCSWCGSIHPEEFMEAAAGKVELAPTDKSYKIYVHLQSMPHAKFYFQHLDEKQRHEFIRLVNSGEIVFGYPGYLYTTPYFCHKVTAEEARKRKG